MSGRFHQSLMRDIMISGAEREPAGVVIGTGLFFLAAAWQFASPVSLIAGVVILTTGLFAIRQIAKRDPKMFAVFRRYLGYRAFYPAHSTPFYRPPNYGALIVGALAALPLFLIGYVLASQWITLGALACVVTGSVLSFRGR